MRTLSVSALALVLSLAACGGPERVLLPATDPCSDQRAALVNTRGVATGIGGQRPDGSTWASMNYSDVSYFFEWGGPIQGCKVTETVRG